MVETSPAVTADTLNKQIEHARASGAIGPDLSPLFELIAAKSLAGAAASEEEVSALGPAGSPDAVERLRNALEGSPGLRLPPGSYRFALLRAKPAEQPKAPEPKPTPAGKSALAALPRDVWIVGGVLIALLIGGFIWLGGGHGPAPDPKASAAAPKPEEVLMKGKLPEKPTDVILGSANAPVQVVEYASLTCSHCAAFMVGNDKKKAVFPEIKAKYIDTGKVRWILREFPLNQFDAAAYLALNCAISPQNPERYHAAADLIFSRQQQWAFSTQDTTQIINNLADLMREVGLGRAQFDSCTKSDGGLAALSMAGQEARETYHVDSTPTFIINGARYAGELEFDRFEAILKPLLH